MTRSRRAIAGVAQVEQEPVGHLSDTHMWGVFDGPRLGPEWPPFDPGADHQRVHAVGWRHLRGLADHDSPAVPRCASPTLVVLAAASILEGYRWLNVMPAGGWQPSALVFVTLVVPLAVVVTRPRRDGRRVVGATLVAAASSILLAVTLLALLVDRPALTHIMGASDLVFAATALGTVVANEHLVRQGI